MYRFLIAPLVSLVALSGCAGSVTLEEAEPFGMVGSALWIHYDDSEQHSIVLTNVVGACAKFQRFYEASEAVYEAIQDVGVDVDDYCVDLEEPMIEFARAGSALYPPGASFLGLSVYEGGDSEPEEEVYEVGDDKGLAGSLTYYEETPYEHILQAYDPEEDFEDGCGLEDVDFEGDAETLTLKEGELDITGVADERSAAGRLTGELRDGDGDDEGDIAASFSAVFCEID